MDDSKEKITETLHLVDALAHVLNDIYLTEDRADLFGKARTKEARDAHRRRAVGLLDHYGLLTDTPAENPVVGDLRLLLSVASPAPRDKPSEIETSPLQSTDIKVLPPEVAALVDDALARISQEGPIAAMKWLAATMLMKFGRAPLHGCADDEG
jgi:hypothetical protein